ncbi:MAG: TonB family protein [Emcibacteraceae bacterium]
MKGEIMVRRIFIILILIFSHAALADEVADKAEFQKLYAQFNDLYANSEDIDPIIEVAEKLYELAPKIYGKNSQNTAVVTYNLASLYLEKAGSAGLSDYDNKARDLFEDYFQILDKIDAPKDKNFVNQYLYYLKSIALEAYQDALPSRVKKLHIIARELDYSQNELADIEFQLGLLLFKNNDFHKSLDYFELSNANYIKSYGSEHFKVGETYFWIAKLQMGDKKRTSAETSFETALKIFDKNPELSKELKQNTHAFMVQLFEDMGLSDKATLHCQAIAEERPKDFDQYIKPIYRKNPTFPELESYEIAKLKKEPAEVTLNFDVDTNGFTKNITVIESSNQKFNESSIEAAKGFRYAPTIKDGNLTYTKDAKVKIVFGISK